MHAINVGSGPERNIPEDLMREREEARISVRRARWLFIAGTIGTIIGTHSNRPNLENHTFEDIHGYHNSTQTAFMIIFCLATYCCYAHVQFEIADQQIRPYVADGQLEEIDNNG